MAPKGLAAGRGKTVEGDAPNFSSKEDAADLSARRHPGQYADHHELFNQKAFTSALKSDCPGRATTKPLRDRNRFMGAFSCEMPGSCSHGAPNRDGP